MQDDADYADYEAIGGLNLYAYCNNNPVMHSDPTGHFGILTLIVGVVASIVAGVVLGNAHRVDVAQNKVDSMLQDMGVNSFSEEQAENLVAEITAKYNTDEVSVGKLEFKDDNAYIENSYLVTSTEDRLLISAIIRNTQDSGKYFTRRSIQSLSAEWFIHNVASAFLPNRRNSSDHVNLDYDFKNNKIGTRIATIIALLTFMY